MKKNKFEHYNPRGKTPLILICDHASNYVPSDLKNLGLSSEDIDKHIAWDIGAATLTREISRNMDACAILCNTSRLVVDVNRSPTEAESIPTVSDGVCIPGNQDLRTIDQKQRIEEFFWPYHNAISATIASYRCNNGYPKNIPAIVSIHTFTPYLESSRTSLRPWDVGVLWNRDPRMSVPFIQFLSEHPKEYLIGNNQPYSGKKYYFSLDFHAGCIGLPHLAIEVRQDLVSREVNGVYWGRIISQIIKKIFETNDIHKILYY